MHLNCFYESIIHQMPFLLSNYFTRYQNLVSLHPTPKEGKIVIILIREEIQRTHEIHH